MVKSRTLTLLAFLLSASCDQEPKPLTQLVLVADTDIAALDAVRFVVHADDGSRDDAESIVERGEAPAFVSVVREEGTIGTLTVSAMGLVNGENAGVVRTQRVSFVPDQTRVVKLHLAASCVRVSCRVGATCSEDGCIPVEIDETQLEPWTGTAPRLFDVPSIDGGTPRDGGHDAAADARTDGSLTTDADTDAGTDASTDASTDAGPTDAGPPADSGLTACDAGWFDLKTDPYHCGASCAAAQQCGSGSQANTINACVAGACCVPSAFGVLKKCELENLGAVCKAGYGDCFDDSTGPLFPTPNTCETDLGSSKMHCGGCNKPCAPMQTCMAGVCR